MNGRDILIYYSVIFSGDWQKIYDAIQQKTMFPSPECVLETVKNLSCNAITLLDDNYPESLKNAYRPPFVLFYYGDISLIKDMRKIVGIVGSREYSNYGKEMTENFTKAICKKMYVVSGLASGIDSIAHRAAIDNGGKTIAVLGTAINKCYPLKNKLLYEEIKNNHLLLSEYPPNAITTKDSFPNRNRIISSLSIGILITEAKKHSGTSITAMHALGQGKTVCCVPERANIDSLCNLLISQGASIVTSGDDVLYELNVIDR